MSKEEANVLWARMAEFAQSAFELGAADGSIASGDSSERQQAATRFEEALEELRLEFYRHTGFVPTVIDKRRYSRDVQLPH